MNRGVAMIPLPDTGPNSGLVDAKKKKEKIVFASTSAPVLACGHHCRCRFPWKDVPAPPCSLSLMAIAPEHACNYFGTECLYQNLTHFC